MSHSSASSTVASTKCSWTIVLKGNEPDEFVQTIFAPRADLVSRIGKDALTVTLRTKREPLPLAPRLQGKLLLMMAPMDDNVHPTSSLQMIDALGRRQQGFRSGRVAQS